MHTKTRKFDRNPGANDKDREIEQTQIGGKRQAKACSEAFK